jgi:UDP-galactose transporter B1
LDGAVHSIEQKLEEQAELHARNPQEQKEAGLFQLVVCVAGIYGSLYVTGREDAFDFGDLG